MPIFKPFRNSAGGVFTPPIKQSVVFNNTNMTRVLTEASDSLTTGTFIAGLRFTGPATGRETIAYFGNSGGSGNMLVIERNSDKIRVFLDAGISRYYETDHSFRDIEHFRLRVILDTPNATADDRVRIYVNNIRLDTSGINVNQSQSLLQGIGNVQEVGSIVGTSKLDNTIVSDVHWYDGVIVTDDTAQFPFGGHTITYAAIPSASDHGTNGYHLEFANSVDYGEDSSGNGHDFSVFGFVSDDQSTDVPGNPYAVLSSIDKGPSVVVSDGGLHCTLANDDKVRSSLSFPYGGDGSFAAEGVAGSSSRNVIGVVNQKYDVQSGNYTFNGVVYHPNGQVHSDGVLDGTYATYTTNDVIEVLTDSSFVWFKKNGVDIYGDSGAKTGGVALPTDSVDLFFAAITSAGSAGAIWDFDFGQRGYTPPVGYTPLKASNLYTPEYYGGDVFGINLRTGTGSAFSVTGSGSKPDLVWSKSRSASASHILSDSVRGVGLNLSSNSAATEVTDAQAVTSFDTDGFSGGTSGTINTSSRSYVDWMFKAGGSSVSNTDGTITSQVSVAPEGHFSIATATTVSAGDSFGTGIDHDLVILKDTGASEHWTVWAEPLSDKSGSTQRAMHLNLSQGEGPLNGIHFQNMSNGTITVGTQARVLGDVVAYNFKNVPGLCKVGSYVGKGSTDGPFIACGFKPRWVLIKQRDATRNWLMFDTTRDSYNPSIKDFYADLPGTEGSSSTRAVDITSNGFKVRASASTNNQNNGNYLYLAIADVAGGGELPWPLGR